MRQRQFGLEAIPEHASISFDHYYESFSEIPMLECPELQRFNYKIMILLIIMLGFVVCISQPAIPPVCSIIFGCMILAQCLWTICLWICPNPANPSDTYDRSSITIIIDDQKNDDDSY